MGMFISVETAKLAKEKGFNLSSPAFYGCDEPASGNIGNQLMIRDWVKITDIGKLDPQDGTLVYSAPEQEMLKEWLRDVHRIHISVSPWKSRDDTVIWFSQVWTLKRFNTSFKSFEYLSMEMKGNTYEEALEVGLYKALECVTPVIVEKRYRCLLCGRSKFTRKSPHNCVGGFRKRGLKWEEIKE